MNMLSQCLKAVTFSYILVLCVGCGASDPEDSNEYGACNVLIDTRESSENIVQNTSDPMWEVGEGWQVVEEQRYGSQTGNSEILFGSIMSYDVDSQGHLYVLDGQAQQIYHFDPSGDLIRTIGNRGSGPGEFENASAVDVSKTGEIWVVEMQKGQLTILNEEGIYQRMERVNSPGSVFLPYAGGFDYVDRYNAVIFCFHDDDMTPILARFDDSYTPIDTIAFPKSGVETEWFKHETPDGSTYSAIVPFQGTSRWQFAVNGNFWVLTTANYELKEMSAGGRVLQTVRKEFEPIPVTDVDMEKARGRLEWFEESGGQIDYSKIPNQKPAVQSFFSDDEGNLWVMRTETDSEQTGPLFDLFNEKGVFLGEVRIPFLVTMRPAPILKDGYLYTISKEESGAEVIVRGKVMK